MEDLDGDGKDEIFIGAGGLNSQLVEPFGFGDGSASGGLFIFYGRSVFDSEYDLSTVDVENPSDLSSLDMALFKGATSTQLDKFQIVDDIDGDGIGELLTENTWNGIDISPLQAFQGIQNIDSVSRYQVRSDEGTTISSTFHSGDINGDGLTDLLLGDTTDWFNGLGRGILIMGSPSLPATMNLSDPTLPQNVEMLYFPGNNLGYLAGSAVFVADLDGDGLAEAIIGAQADDTVLDDAGCAYVLYGQDIADSLAGTHPIVNKQSGESIALNGESTALGANTICGDIANAYMPKSIFTSDTDADGIQDLLLGSWNYGLGTSPGAGFYFNGYELSALSGELYLANEANHAVFGQVNQGEFSFGGAGGGDFNGDGAQDIAYSAPEAGAVYLMLGGV